MGPSYSYIHVSTYLAFSLFLAYVSEWVVACWGCRRLR